MYTPVHETVEKLLTGGKAPIYVVHFTQRDAIERAQSLTSMRIITPEEEGKNRRRDWGFSLHHQPSAVHSHHSYAKASACTTLARRPSIDAS